MSDSIHLVREFHERFEQAIADQPNISDAKLNELRVKLLQEELDELTEALRNGDPVATLDALTDLQYVLDGAYLALGFHAMKDAATREVHRSNMSKLGADGRPVYRTDGKVTKGPHYSPPDLEAVLAAHDRESPFDDDSRCAVCAWPLAESAKEGCVRGNCSERPRPERLYSPTRAALEWRAKFEVAK